MTRPCVVCQQPFTPRRAKVMACSKHCACVLGHRRHPRVHPKMPPKRCPECLTDFQPHHRTQTCCGRHCAAARIARHQRPRLVVTMLKAAAARRAQQRQQLALRVQDMTPVEAYKLGYKRGLQAHWTKLVRDGVIQPRVRIGAPSMAQREGR